jgi:hypothetical protein
LPSGHPEAFFEAFANVYRAAFDDMCGRAAGHMPSRAAAVYPTIDDGVEGMLFIERCVASSRDDGAWQDLRHPRARR